MININGRAATEKFFSVTALLFSVCFSVSADYSSILRAPSEIITS